LKKPKPNFKKRRQKGERGCFEPELDQGPDEKGEKGEVSRKKTITRLLHNPKSRAQTKRGATKTDVDENTARTWGVQLGAHFHKYRIPGWGGRKKKGDAMVKKKKK